MICNPCEVFWQSPVTNCYHLKVSEYLPDATSDSYTIKRIINVVCKYFGRTEQEIKSRSRKRELVIARQFCAFFIRKNTSLPLVSIGRILNRDHTSMIYAVNAVGDLTYSDERMKKALHELQNII